MQAMDRRVSARTRSDFPVVAYQNGAAHRSRVVDLSTGGALLQRQSSGRPPMIQRVELQFDGRSVSTMARTVWAEGRLHAIRFVGMNDVDRLDIAEHLDRLQRR